MNTIAATRIKIEPLSSVALWTNPLLVFKLYCLEPGEHRFPHPAIPAGNYVLRLRTIGQKHQTYARYYDDRPGFHQGMVEIFGVPGRTAIEFHVGNYLAESEGCSLAGTSYHMGPDGHYGVGASRLAYEKAYPIIRDLILAGPTTLALTDAVGVLDA